MGINAMNFLINHAEYIALVMNSLIFLSFLWNGQSGKALYWFGTIIVVLGLLRMKG
jgi:hypothetical protein